VPEAPLNQRYLNLVGEIERSFPVARWLSGDVEIWPLARMDLYLDMFRASLGGESPRQRGMPARFLGLVAASLRNMWRNRRALKRWVLRARPAHAIFLGDGVSLDFIDGEWHDRFGEPIVAALESRGLATFVMQGGDGSRLPWHRATFAANLLARRGIIVGNAAPRSALLPDHEKVMEFLVNRGVQAPSLGRAMLERRAAVVAATASGFQRILRKVRPAVAFVVTYYAGLGAAFLLACRREGVLSVDLQHCPQDGAHRAYTWEALPERGYATLPAVFWNWTSSDAEDIRRWANRLAQPWHQSLHGGHTQFAALFASHQIRLWDAKFAALAGGQHFDREILVALQPISAFRERWDALASQIQAAPAGWRWWIRRHPAASLQQESDYQSLTSLRGRSVMVQESSELPLPVLLRHMSVVVSQFSGASIEGAYLGLPAIFLNDEARGQFYQLIERGLASVVPVEQLLEAIARLSTAEPVSMIPEFPSLHGSLMRLEQLAHEYAQLQAAGNGSR
jgi:hypothetical protein